KVLLAESFANRVTERNLKGEILWQKELTEPLVAQRLPNGNTFIATKTQMVEVNAKGDEVGPRRDFRAGEQIMRAQRTTRGYVLVLADNSGASRCLYLNAAGREIHSFP